MINFKQYLGESMNRNSMLASEFSKFLSDHTKLDKSIISKFINKINDNNISHYKLASATYKDYDFPQLSREDLKTVEKLFANAQASISAKIQK